MGVGFLLVFLLGIIIPTTYAVEHVVGGSAGWAPGVDYTKWAAGETFQIGDTLQFCYDTTLGVNQVTLESYDTCATNNPITVYTGGSTTITLNDRGPMYFICPTPGYCAGNGMKLSIIVFAGAPNGPTNTTTPTVPGTMIYTPPGDSQQTNGTFEVIPFCGGSSFVEVNYFVIGVSMVLAMVLEFIV